MKPKDNFNRLISLIILLFIVSYFIGCIPDRTVTDPDYEAEDVRRPAVEHHVPLSDATGISRSTTISVWFDELMNESSVQNNFGLWPSVKIESTKVIAVTPGNPDIMYTAKSGTGIFRSDDGADSWNWTTPGSMKMVINDLIVSQSNSNLVYAATADSGIYKSLDGGVNWQKINDGLPEMNIIKIAIDPNNEDVLYAITSANGVYKSVNGGVNWSEKNNGIRISREPQDIVINPLNSNVLYIASQGDFVLKSYDGGENWTRLRTGFYTNVFIALAIHPQDTSLVFAGSNGGGMYRTDDGGFNWTLINNGLTNLQIQDIILNTQDTNIILINTEEGIFRSLDKGQNWIAIGDIPSEEVSISVLAVDPLNPDRLFAGTSAGIYRSEDLGDSWIKRNSILFENLYVSGSIEFETWQDSTTIIAPINSIELDTTIIFPYIYERALAAWLANNKKGEPPVEVNPLATIMIFNPLELLLPNQKYQARIKGTFESDRETLRDSYGAEDINGNSFEVDYNFTFITGEN